MRISDWSSDVCSSDLGLDTGAVIEHGMTSTLQFVHQVPDLLAATARRDHHRVVSRDDDHVLQPDGGDQRPAGADQAVFGVDGHHIAEIGRHTSELQSLMRISYAVLCLKKKKLIKKKQKDD